MMINIVLQQCIETNAQKLQLQFYII